MKHIEIQKRRHIYVGETQWTNIKKVAQKRDKTISALIRDSIRIVYEGNKFNK